MNSVQLKKTTTAETLGNIKNGYKWASFTDNELKYSVVVAESNL